MVWWKQLLLVLLPVLFEWLRKELSKDEKGK